MLSLPIKRYLLVGSYALGVRPAKDIDVICYREDIEVETSEGDDYACSFVYNGWKVECLLADEQESLQFILKHNIHKTVADRGMLWAIKAGHIMFPHRQWEKHIMDYHILKSSVNVYGLNVTFREHFGDYSEATQMSYRDVSKLHKKSTEDRLGKQKLPKLKGTTKEEFFDDFVVKYIEHDSIHQMVAHKEKPMYSYMQHDPNIVECDKELWNAFTFEEKVWCVTEECYVIALERHVIPTLKGDRVGLNSHEAFKWALMRVCTTLCSGWFRQFAIDHYFDILNNYNREYIKLLDQSQLK